MKRLVGALLLACGAAAAQAPSPPVPQALADGVWLLPGRFERARQPDGNSLLLQGKDGLVVIDTGRHAEHAQAIEDWVRARGAPLVAVVNTHWHLDHLGGNAALRRVRPGLQVHASGAVRQAIEIDMPRSERDLQQMRAKPDLDDDLRRMIDIDLGLYAVRAALLPDREVDAEPADRLLGGRRLRLGVLPGPTRGDTWVLDVDSGLLAVGDFVTLPVPFLDTACAPRWQASMAALDALPYRRVVPGHGPVMSREDFGRYRRGFDRLLECAASDRDAGACAAQWTADLGPLLPAGSERSVAPMLGYYIGERLRAAAADRQRLCGPPG